MGMFEQSMLLPNTAGKRTGALAASITMQTAVVGVILLVPLIYNDRLPFIAHAIPVNLPVRTPPPAPEPSQHPVASSQAPSMVTATSHVFHLPARAPTISPTAATIDIEGPPTNWGDTLATPVGLSLTPIHVEAIASTSHAATAPKAETIRIPVGGDVQAAKLIKKVVPSYPALAKMARVSGTVRLSGIIAKDGTIQQLQVIAGNPLLIAAAVDAVRQWIYRPTTLNGETVEVIAPIDVIFTLSQ
jgi:protein TonB